MFQGPNQGYYGADMYGGYPNYGYGPQETESQKKLRIEELMKTIETNRLYLKKIRKQCVKEDFADIGKTQMFLFEFLIESLEVNAKSELGLVSDSDKTSELVARVQFLDTPAIEIREKGETIGKSASVLGQTEYLQTIGNAGLSNALDPGSTTGPQQGGTTSNSIGSIRKPEAEPSVVEYDTKWENASGKSLLFSKTALEIIQGLDRSPVKLQVSRCTDPTKKENKDTKEVKNTEKPEEKNTVKQEEKNTEKKEEKKIDMGFIKKEDKDTTEKKDTVLGVCEPLGYALLRLPDHFGLSILQSCKAGVILPVSCIHRETCQIRNVFGSRKGELKVFIRLSCFGSVIATSFQSVGPERRYVFKPSPQPAVDSTDESDVNRDSVLKPIVVEEEVAKGITMTGKDEDIFKKTVLWKDRERSRKNLFCICGGIDLPSKLGAFKESSLRMPRPSDYSLCRNTNTSQKPGQPFCEWHRMVRKEIQNGPRGNCGCLDGVNVIKGPIPSQDFSTQQMLSARSQVPSRLQKLNLEPTYENKPIQKTQPMKTMQEIQPMKTMQGIQQIKTTQEIQPTKILQEKQSMNPIRPKQPVNATPPMHEKVPEKKASPIRGFGFDPDTSETIDCKCCCGMIRKSLEKSPMMKYTWDVK